MPKLNGIIHQGDKQWRVSTAWYRQHGKTLYCYNCEPASGDRGMNGDSFTTRAAALAKATSRIDGRS